MILSLAFGFFASDLNIFSIENFASLMAFLYKHSFDHHYRGVYLQSGLQAKSNQIPPSSTDCDWWADNYFISADIIFSIKVPPQTPVIMDQTGKRIVGEVLGPLNQGQTLTLDCLVTGGKACTLPGKYTGAKRKETSMINAITPSFP